MFHNQITLVLLLTSSALNPENLNVDQFEKASIQYIDNAITVGGATIYSFLNTPQKAYLKFPIDYYNKECGTYDINVSLTEDLSAFTQFDIVWGSKLYSLDPDKLNIASFPLLNSALVTCTSHTENRQTIYAKFLMSLGDHEYNILNDDLRWIPPTLTIAVDRNGESIITFLDGYYSDDSEDEE